MKCYTESCSFLDKQKRDHVICFNVEEKKIAQHLNQTTIPHYYQLLWKLNYVSHFFGMRPPQKNMKLPTNRINKTKNKNCIQMGVSIVISFKLLAFIIFIPNEWKTSYSFYG